ncbi:MAG: hypothetical protein CMM93_06770 [Rickettsiales bacterium]|nr:hypothetical protein [Rickettsiales bacterium]
MDHAIDLAEMKLISRKKWGDLPENIRISYSYKAKTKVVNVKSAFYKKSIARKKDKKEFVIVRVGKKNVALLKNNIIEIRTSVFEMQKARS